MLSNELEELELSLVFYLEFDKCLFKESFLFAVDLFLLIMTLLDGLILIEDVSLLVLLSRSTLNFCEETDIFSSCPDLNAFYDTLVATIIPID